MPEHNIAEQARVSPVQMEVTVHDMVVNAKELNPNIMQEVFQPSHIGGTTPGKKKKKKDEEDK